MGSLGNQILYMHDASSRGAIYDRMVGQEQKHIQKKSI